MEKFKAREFIISQNKKKIKILIFYLKCIKPTSYSTKSLPEVQINSTVLPEFKVKAFELSPLSMQTPY